MRRTAAPDTTIAPSATSASDGEAIRYVSGRIGARHSDARRARIRCTAPGYGPCRRAAPDAAADGFAARAGRGPSLPVVSATSALDSRPRSLAYVALTKPRIIELLLVTTVPTMIVAERGLPSLWLMVCTVLGGTLAAGGANAINMYVDRDIDTSDGAHQEPAARHRRDVAPGRPHLRHRPRGRGLRLPVGHRQPAQRRAGRGRLPLLRVRVHALAEAHLDPQHRHRRRRRRGAGAHRLELGHRHASTGRPSCCSPSSSTGPRRTSGPWPSATETTTRPPTCRCCRSVESLRRHLGAHPRLHACCCGRSPSRSRRWPAWVTSTWAPPSSSGRVFTWYAVRLLRMPRPAAAHRRRRRGRRVEVRATAMRLFTWSITYITLLFGAMAARPAPALRMVTASRRRAGSKAAGPT